MVQAAWTMVVLTLMAFSGLGGVLLASAVKLALAPSHVVRRSGAADRFGSLLVDGEHAGHCEIARIATSDGVRPCGGTESSGNFNRLLGVLIVELRRAEVTQGRVQPF